MSIKYFLSQTQKEWLQQALRESNCPHFRKRILMLLLRNDGKNYEQIADFIGCSKRTVAYWCVHGNPEHLESLQDQREQGNHRKVTAAYIQLLLEVVEKEPEKLGYEFGRWTGERLATYLAEQTGIELSSAQVRRILRQKKVCLPLSKTQSREPRPGKTEVIKQRLQVQ